MTATTTTASATGRTADGQVPVVAFTDVNKSYGAVHAVAGLSLGLHPGETVALLGPNGAGKSTALDLPLGLRNADRGSVRVLGTTPAQAIAAGQPGSMPPTGGLMEEVTVRGLVGLACELHPKAYPVDRVPAAADGVTDFASRLAGVARYGPSRRPQAA